MGENKVGSIMRTLAETLNIDGKKISNHSTRKTIVANLKTAGKLRHKIIQITGQSSESSLDDYDEVDEDEIMELSHIISGYLGTAFSASTRLLTSTSSSVF